MCHAIPYKQHTRHMTQSLVGGYVDMLNHFTSKNSISDTMRPSKIVEGRQKMDLLQNIIEYVSYALIYVGKNNTMQRRSVPEISLKTSNNPGGAYFMSIYTGKIPHSSNW